VEVSFVFVYREEQKTYNIGGIRIGGYPGKTPTVLVGSIFYSQDPLVSNAQTGEFDKSQAESLLNALVEVSEKTGIPTVLDIVATSTESIVKYMDYLTTNTEFPLMIDGSDSVEVNTSGIRYAEEAGILDRVILNSFSPETGDELYDVVQETGLKSVLLLAFSSRAVGSSVKRVELADGLIARAQAAGVSNIMIDTGVIDIPTLGLACKANQLLKDKYGFPVGCGAHNAINTWRGLVPKFGKVAKKPAMVGSILMPVSLGADFVMYGPIKHAPLVYPSVAMIDAALSGVLLETRTKPDLPHPRYLIS
jgi:tetrahydromethanopterin S-methyltransferase subunit H